MSGPLDISLAVSAIYMVRISGYKTGLAIFLFFILYTIGFAIAADVVEEELSRHV